MKLAPLNFTQAYESTGPNKQIKSQIKSVNWNPVGRPTALSWRNFEP